jgi:hypothetical protein
MGSGIFLAPYFRNSVAATDYMTKTPEIYRNELMNGLYSRLAKQLRVSRSHVYRVAQGERSSPRVDRALRNELQKIDRAVAKYESECKSVRSVAA